MASLRPRHSGDQDDFAEFAETGDSRLRAKLIESHLGVAHHLARRMSYNHLDDDLDQVASVALVKAVDRYDPDRGVAFSTFATRTILGELKRHFRDKGWDVKAPRRIQELYLELGHVAEELTHELGRAPTVAELAAATSQSEESVLEALEAGRNYSIASIYAPSPTAEDSTPLVDQLGEIDTGFVRTDMQMELSAAIADLPERQRKVVRLRFIEDLTQSEIASELGISQMHVSRLLAKTISELRRKIASAA